MQLFPCFCDNTFIFLAFKIPLILTIYDHVGGNLISFISCNFTPFYPIEMGFSLYIFFLCSKNVCNVLNTALQVFNGLTKTRTLLVALSLTCLEMRRGGFCCQRPRCCYTTFSFGILPPANECCMS